MHPFSFHSLSLYIFHWAVESYLFNTPFKKKRNYINPIKLTTVQYDILYCYNICKKSNMTGRAVIGNESNTRLCYA